MIIRLFFPQLGNAFTSYKWEFDGTLHGHKIMRILASFIYKVLCAYFK